jgi:hypothetical protein
MNDLTLDEELSTPEGRAAVGNLLAVLNGDGGHHLAKVGLVQAAKDAEARYVALSCEVDNFVDTVNRADAHWGSERGGQQVPFHGDFGYIPPSAQNRLRWWAARLKRVLSGNASA